MLNLDDLFSTQTPYDHPKLRYWRSLLQRHSQAELRVELRRERDGLTFLPASLYVSAVAPDGTVLSCDQEPWEDELNLTLVREGFRAPNEENEAMRFGLMLRHLFRPIETRFGDGYFNAVLIDYLKASGFADHPEVKAKLDAIHEYTPPQSSAANDCRERLRSVLVQCARWLVDNLKYQRATAEDILGGAVAYYLDERYSITNRRLMGW